MRFVWQRSEAMLRRRNGAAAPRAVTWVEVFHLCNSVVTLALVLYHTARHTCRFCFSVLLQVQDLGGNWICTICFFSVFGSASFYTFKFSSSGMKSLNDDDDNVIIFNIMLYVTIQLNSNSRIFLAPIISWQNIYTCTAVVYLQPVLINQQFYVSVFNYAQL